MSANLLLSYTPMETRVALVEHGSTQDIHIERSVNRGLVGNIYAGKVSRIMPGMQSAFVDIGEERNAFIHASDFATDGQKISDHLHDGKKLIVQVIHDPVGTKGARVTTQLSLATRNLVLQPHKNNIGVSQLIEDSSERERLQQLLARARVDQNLNESAGFVLRTAAEGIGLDVMSEDLRFLCSLWSAISQRGKAATKATLLHEELPLHLRMVRDIIQPSVERIIVDSAQCYQALLAFCADYAPGVTGLLEPYTGEQLLFDAYGVENDIQGALGRRVELESGGYLIFDQTEAMATIDVNTGSFVGKRNQSRTLLKTNLEAVAVLAQQLRLRNLGGIIVVDFINMEVAEHRRQVHDALRKAVQEDPARTRVAGFSKLCLVEITRKRTRESLQSLLCEECSVCQRRGVVKTAETVSYEIFRHIMRDARSDSSDTLVVRVAPPVAEYLLDKESEQLSDLQKFIGKSIRVRAEPAYNPEHFDIRPL